MALVNRVGSFCNYVSALNSRLKRSKRGISRGLRQRSRKLSVASFEGLEARTFLSAVLLNGNALQFTGDAGSSNSVNATLGDDGQIHASINGNNAAFSLSNVQSIQVVGGNSGDTIVIDPRITVPLTVTCGNGNDYVSAGGGNSTVYGNGGNDTIIGNGGQNEFHGGAGDDSLIGGSGRSVLYGDDGNDTIIGGSGNDLIGGGPGNNVTQGPPGDIIINTTDSQSTPVAFHFFSLSAHILFKSTNTIYSGEAVQVNGLNSGLGGGNPDTAHYQWNFGDPNGSYNNLDGWNAAHIYNAPGIYMITFTITNHAGQVTTDVQPVFVLPASLLRTIYVAPWGNDSNDGLSQNDPIQTVAQANSMLGSNTRLLFAAGATYNVESSINIDRYTHVEIATYGSGSQPVLMWDGPATSYNQIIITQPGSSNFAITNFTFDSIYSNGNGEPNALKFNGRNNSVSDCTFFHLSDDFDLSGAPIGTMIQDNQSPSNQDLRSYFAWVQGANTVILGNFVPNSDREHVIRIGGAKQTLIAYNNLANISGAAWGDSADIVKGVITIQVGSYAYVDHNVLNGPSSVGPLATTQFGSLVASFNGTFNYAVFDANTITNGPFQFEPAGFHTMLRNNVFMSDNATAIIIQPYDELYGRIVSDARIIGNTVINNGTVGNFLHLETTADSVVLADNLYIAPNLQVGNFESAPVYVGDSSLQSFALISNNIWPSNSTVSGGINYVWPSWWDPRGYLTSSAWASLSPVSGDVFQNNQIDAKDNPNFNGVGATYGIPLGGLFSDFNGNPRSGSNVTVGAVQLQ
ncbi:MAG: PKD domain-containing protein [Planctomycetota bacterium]|nr:PKD domain-containing protein [Planctomycetota bacterium]